MSDIKCQVSGVKYNISMSVPDIKCQGSDVMYNISSVSDQVSSITCQVPVSDITCQRSGVKYNMSSVGVRYHVSEIKCQV